MYILEQVIQCLAAILLADFVSGFVHWLEDSFWDEATPLIGPWLIAPNLEHHRQAAAFLRKNWWQSSWDLLLTGLVILTIAWQTETLALPLAIFLLFAVNANQVHKWAHSPARKLPRSVDRLQQLGILQSRRHHSRHHRLPNDTNYCVLTPWLNPLLDGLKFWRGLEHGIFMACGFSCRGYPRIPS